MDYFLHIIRGEIQKKNIFAYTESADCEACRDTQTSIWLANPLVRAPNSRSGGQEYESPMRWELGALTKSEKTSVHWELGNSGTGNSVH
jgi:hypothetical protein